MILALIDGTLRAAPGAARSGRRGIATTCSPRTPTRSRRSRRRSRTTCWRSIEQLERDAVRLRRPTPAPTSNPLGACAITGTGFPIDRGAHDGAARLRRRDRQHLRQHRDRRLPARERVGAAGAARRARPRRAGPAAVVHERVRLPAAGGRLRAVQQHHAAEAQPGRARARARDCQQGGRPGGGRSCSRSTTRRSATSSTPRTICSRWCSRCSATPIRAVAPGRGGDGARDVRHARGWPSGPRQGWITVTELADTLARDHGVPFKAGHAIASRLVAEPRAPAEAPLSSAPARGLGGGAGPSRSSTTRRRWRDVLSPQHFVDVRTTPGGPAPSETARAMRVSRRCWRRTRHGSERCAWKAAQRRVALDDAAAGLTGC